MTSKFYRSIIITPASAETATLIAAVRPEMESIADVGGWTGESAKGSATKG